MRVITARLSKFARQVYIVRMDFKQTAWILVITAILVHGEKCPYVDPQARSMTCIKDLPGVSYRPVNNRQQQQHGTGTHGTYNKRRKRRRSYNGTEMTSSVEMPPPSTPDMTFEFFNYFCSKYGVEMVHCAKELIEKCSSHPSMREALFNPIQALEAQAVCHLYVTPSFNTTLHCVNQIMSTDSVIDCVTSIYYSNRGKRRIMASPENMCRAMAGTYNCFVSEIGPICGYENVGFIVAVMRSMEERYCRNIVDNLYSDPLKWTSFATSQKHHIYLLAFALLLSYILRDVS